MKIAYGTTRIVIVMPHLGIAIKMARIDFYLGLRRLFIEPVQEKSWRLFISQVLWDSDTENSFRQAWFRGVTPNWREFCLYLKSQHRVLQPTYFSFFGLFNIQKVSTTPLIAKSDIFKQFMHLSGDRTGRHCFENPENFCWNNGLKILDYGDKRMTSLIADCGDALASFDPDWDFQAFKKKPARSISVGSSQKQKGDLKCKDKRY